MTRIHQKMNRIKLYNTIDGTVLVNEIFEMICSEMIERQTFIGTHP